jgi:hypothetical protein
MRHELDGSCCHEEAAQLLPWYVVGRLSGAEVEGVSRHLRHCVICRNDVAEQSAIRALLKAQDYRIDRAPQMGLAKTLARVDERSRYAPSITPTRLPIRAAQRRGVIRWLTAAVLLQAIALGYLGSPLRRRASPGTPLQGYETLSAEPKATSELHIRAVFSAAMTLADLKALLNADDLMVVRGPTRAGVYTLASNDPRLTTTQVGALVSRLRSNKRVLFADVVVNDAMAAP